jgi:hypothetical protein
MAQIKVNQYSIPDDAIDSEHYIDGWKATIKVIKDKYSK